MPKFRLTVKFYDFANVDVEADNVAEAVKKSAQFTREDYQIFDGNYIERMGVEELKK